METKRQAVSDVVNALKALNIDDRLSTRYVLSRLENKTKYYLKQDLDSRRLFKTSDIWKPIKCFRLKKIDFLDCPSDIPNCQFIMQSVEKLPEVYTSNYGSLLKVMTINKAKEYKQIKIWDYTDISNREVRDITKKYYWINDGRIEIPDSEVEEVFIIGMFPKQEQVDSINKENSCKSYLDFTFVCPDYLLKVVKDETIIEFVKAYKPIVEDEKGDLDTNSKN